MTEPGRPTKGDHVKEEIGPVDAYMWDEQAAMYQLVGPHQGLAIREVDGRTPKESVELGILVGEGNGIGVAQVDVGAGCTLPGSQANDLFGSLGRQAPGDRYTRTRERAQACSGRRRLGEAVQIRPVF